MADDEAAKIRKEVESEFSTWDETWARQDGFESLEDLIEAEVAARLNPDLVHTDPGLPGAYDPAAPGTDYVSDGGTGSVTDGLGRGSGSLVDAGAGPSPLGAANRKWLFLAGGAVACAVVVAAIVLGGGSDDDQRVDDSQSAEGDGDARVDEGTSDPVDDDETRADDSGDDAPSDDTRADDTGTADDAGADDDEQPVTWSSLGGLSPSFLAFSTGDQVGAVAIDRVDDSVIVWWVPPGFGLDNLHFQSRPDELVQAGPEGLGVQTTGEVVEGSPFHECADGSRLWLTVLEGGRIAVIGGTFETPFADVGSTDLGSLVTGLTQPALDTAIFDAFPDCEPLLSTVLVTEFEF